jgi:hypothetical protein
MRVLQEEDPEMDHGYQVNEDKRCTAKTQKLRQCTLPPLVGIELCALHAGLARPKHDPAYGDPRVLEAYKRSLAARASAPQRTR